MPVLFERQGRYAGQILGRSPFMQPVHAEAPERLIGTVADCRVVEVLNNSLKGEIPILETARGAGRATAERASA